MNMNDTIASKYLKAADLKGRTVKVCIDSVSMDDLSQDNKPPEIKACVKLRDRKKSWVLNRTNTVSLIKFFGPESNDWAGKTVELYAVDVMVNNEQKEGLRCKLPTEEDFDDDVDM